MHATSMIQEVGSLCGYCRGRGLKVVKSCYYGHTFYSLAEVQNNNNSNAKSMIILTVRTHGQQLQKTDIYRARAVEPVRYCHSPCAD